MNLQDLTIVWKNDHRNIDNSDWSHEFKVGMLPQIVQMLKLKKQSQYPTTGTGMKRESRNYMTAITKR